MRPRNARATGNRQESTTQFVDAPSSVIDVVLGVLTQIARKYLFVSTTNRALFYLSLVFVLSLISEFVTLPENYYFIQKNNAFNQYGTKLGWFWTCLLQVPFIWLTSLLHHGSRRKAFRDLSRLVVATGLWHFCTAVFVKVEKHTGVCYGVDNASRSECVEKGGKWIPGFDISGHAFLLLYAILVINEEASSFRNWPSSPRQSANFSPNHYEYLNYRTSTKIVQCLFIATFFLHILWESQLVVTLLYYHTISHKVIGALVALGCWFATYRVWYRMVFPFGPIRRHSKTFN